MNTCYVTRDIDWHLRQEAQREAEHEALMARADELASDPAWIENTLFDACSRLDMSGFFPRDIEPKMEKAAALLAKPELTTEQMREVIDVIKDALSITAYSQAEDESV